MTSERDPPTGSGFHGCATCKMPSPMATRVAGDERDSPLRASESPSPRCAPALQLLLTVVAFGACHATPVVLDAPPQGSTVAGTIAGSMFDVADAVSGCGLLAGQSTVHVVLFNIPDACAVIGTSWPAGEEWLQLDLFDVDLSMHTSPTATLGPHTVISDDPTSTGSFAAAQFVGLSMTLPYGVSGTVDVARLEASVAGTFDMTLSTADHITGSFDAPHCDATSPGPAPNGDLFPCTN